MIASMRRYRSDRSDRMIPDRRNSDKLHERRCILPLRGDRSHWSRDYHAATGTPGRVDNRAVVSRSGSPWPATPTLLYPHYRSNLSKASGGVRYRIDSKASAILDPRSVRR